jgi:hypothetical protein
MKMDYKVVEIPNTYGELSSSYPSTILIPEYELKGFANFNSTFDHSQSQQTEQNQQPPPQLHQETIYEKTFDEKTLRELINKARFAR